MSFLVSSVYATFTTTASMEFLLRCIGNETCLPLERDHKITSIALFCINLGNFSMVSGLSFTEIFKRSHRYFCERFYSRGIIPSMYASGVATYFLLDLASERGIISRGIDHSVVWLFDAGYLQTINAIVLLTLTTFIANMFICF
ncbi:MAG: hypothetical protein MRY21_02025 [Simkaniaceae bacterium]|nr:hypothetical protein [Simkaniaceae bacterium]